MKISSVVTRRRLAGISAGWLLGGLSLGIIGAPSAAAASDCSPAGVNATVSSVTGAAQQYLAAHPDTNQVVMAAYGQSPAEAESSLRGILAPIGDTERQCNVTALPSNLEAAYHTFMAG
jgi:heme-binding protein